MENTIENYRDLIAYKSEKEIDEKRINKFKQTFADELRNEGIEKFIKQSEIVKKECWVKRLFKGIKSIW